MLRLLVVSCILMLAVISSQGKVPSTLPFTSIRVKGELQERLERNFQRLECILLDNNDRSTLFLDLIYNAENAGYDQRSQS